MSPHAALRPQPTPLPTPAPLPAPTRAPARPTTAAALHSVSAVTAVLLGLVAIGAMIHEPVLIPPLAASAALVHSAPTLPLAQPRGVIVGHLVGAAVGYAVLAAAGGSAWAAAVAAGVTLALNMVARTPHSLGRGHRRDHRPAGSRAGPVRPAPVRFDGPAGADRFRRLPGPPRGAEVPRLLVVTGRARPARARPVARRARVRSKA